MIDSISAVLCRLARSGVSAQWRDGKAVFRAAAEPPSDIVALIDARKADISAFLCPEAVQLRLGVDPPRPPDVTNAQWEVALSGLRAFLANGHGAEAERLGWTRDELYCVPPVWARVDSCGVGLLIGDREVFSITAAEIRIKTPSGAMLAFYRKPQIDYRLVYETRRKLLRRDVNDDEAHCRAFEHAVSVFRDNISNASLEDAKAAVLAAIAKSKETSEL